MSRRWRLAIVLVLAIGVLSVFYLLRDKEEPAAPAGGLSLSSPVFVNGGMIPAAFTCDGRNVSPPLQWSDVPAGTASFALVVEDPDAPIGNFTHWMIADIPGEIGGLPEGVPAGDVVSQPVRAVQGVNGFHRSGYGGPCPPAGELHRYYFRLYALDERLEMSGGFTKNQLRAAMSGHVLGEATLMGRYERVQ